jgi:hypothetical protein
VNGSRPVPDSAVAKAFQSYLDNAKLNESRHDSSRSDTFKTPGKLDKKLGVPGHLDKRYALGDSYSIIDICEKAFGRRAEKLTDMFASDLKAEMQQATEQIRSQLAETVKALTDMQQVTTGVQLSQVHEKIDKLEERTAQPANVDWAPVREILSLEVAGRMSRFEDQLTGKVSEILKEVSVLKEQQEKAASVLGQQISTEVHNTLSITERADSKITQIVADQSVLIGTSQNLTQQVDQFQKEAQFNMTEGLRTQMRTITKEWAETFDHSRSFEKLRIGQKEIKQDFLELLGEVAKIQQALNVDFAHVMDEVKNLTIGVDAEKESRKSLCFPSAGVVSFGAVETTELLHEEVPSATLSLSLENGGGGRVSRKSTAHAPPRIARKRFRDFSAQTDSHNKFEEIGCQTDEQGHFAHKKKKREKHQKSVNAPRPTNVAAAAKHAQKKAVFADAEEMKKQAREALVRPQYNVFDHYSDSGCFQRIARSSLFENITFFVISANAVWIAVELDENNAELLVDSKPIFQVVENVFCIYFTGELCIRFLAFHYKRSCLQDFWFCFDLLLVFMMIVETWGLTAVFLLQRHYSGGGGGASFSTGGGGIFRVARLAKMTRISRMVRLLRAVPELLVIIKGISAAARSVTVFSVLWLLIVYVFGIIFRTIIADTAGDYHFSTIPLAMRTLLLNGILPSHAAMIEDVVAVEPMMWPVILFYVILTYLTLLNMLIGVMVEVVGVIGATQRESMVVTLVASQLREAFMHLNKDTEIPLSKFEFQQLLGEPQIIKVLSEANVDVVALVEATEITFQDLEKERGSQNAAMSFEKFAELVLDMRGTNPTTIKDVKEQIRIFKSMINESSTQMENFVGEELGALRMELHAQHSERLARDAARDNQEDGEDSDPDDEADPPDARHSSNNEPTTRESRRPEQTLVVPRRSAPPF